MNVNIHGILLPDNQPAVPIDHTLTLSDDTRDENIWAIIHEFFKRMGIEHYLVTYDKVKEELNAT